ncbi:MAG: hypothetical protein PWQ70_2992 [Clostridiales bacterium]|nr:hypothetical protein [Clostridiales bacterium]
MLTKGQKRFRKEIEKSLKEIENRDQGFYSYIEKAYINSYYNSKTKSSISIPIVAMLCLITILCSTYLFFRSDGLNNHKSDLSNSDPTILKHEKIVSYLEQMKHYHTQALAISNNSVDALNKMLKNPLLYKKSFDEMLIKNKEQIENIMLEIKKISPPDEFQDYHKAAVGKHNFIYEKILYIIDAGSTRSKERISQINILSDKINFQIKQEKKEMLSALDKVGIEYEKLDNGQIRYTYKKDF